MGAGAVIRKKIVRLLGMAALAVAVVALVAYRQEIDVEAVHAWIRSRGIWAPVVFMLAYAVGTVLFLPGSLMSLVGGAVFGPGWGILYNLTGATLGAVVAFLLARYVASSWVARRSGTRLKHLIQGVETEGWRFVAFARLVPLFPFNLLNHALGLTQIRLSHYFLATFVCMIPGAVAYTYLGYAGSEAVGGADSLAHKALLGLGLLALVVFLPHFLRRLRGPNVVTVDQVRRCLEAGHQVIVLDVRESVEFNGPKGHLSGAVNIPLRSLQHRLAQINMPRDCPVMVMSGSDRTSSMAVEVLARSGFDARVVKGGIDQWHSAGWPLERALP